MKKFLMLMLSLSLMLLPACGEENSTDDSGKLSKTDAVSGLFKTDATIDETVLYDENNIKIIANELSYGNFSAELKVTLENNSDTDLSFNGGSLGYSANAINGYMMDDGFLNCDVPSGQIVSDTIKFDFSNMYAYGINEIADIEIGLKIKTPDSKYTYTGPLQIKTSAFESYDHSANTYRKVMNNGVLEDRLNCTVNYFSEDSLYDKYNIRITSVAVMTNKDGEPALLFEIENDSPDTVYAKISGISINEYPVYKGTWSTDCITANNSCVAPISLSKLANQYEGDAADISKVSDISFTFGIGENGYQTADSQEISVKLPKKVTLVSEKQ